MSDELYLHLNNLMIPYKLHEHQPIFTSEEGAVIAHLFEGALVKNLFMTNRKGYYALLTVLDHKRVNIKELQKIIGQGNLSFAKAEDLLKYLNITPGSLTPCCLIYDKELKVEFFLDEEILQFDLINVHPLRNDRTITLTTKDMIKFVEASRHSVKSIKIPTRAD